MPCCSSISLFEMYPFWGMLIPLIYILTRINGVSIHFLYSSDVITVRNARQKWAPWPIQMTLELQNGFNTWKCWCSCIKTCSHQQRALSIFAKFSATWRMNKQPQYSKFFKDHKQVKLGIVTTQNYMWNTTFKYAWSCLWKTTCHTVYKNKSDF